ncbi:MAG: cytochrome c biogenesis protein CcsA [Phycisphaerales bacterium]|jgi:cytochrome c-type biogenesis protein CcsB|nr:cytochrome c biogenesis protein CcsA [Phycisphaerales bacterium]
MNLRQLFAGILVLACTLSGSVTAQDAFTDQVDLRPLSEIAVNTSGRLKSLGSHANSMMDAVSGPRKIGDREPLFTYFDMMFRPEAYEDADVVYIKNKAVREAIVKVFQDGVVDDPDLLVRFPELIERMESFRATGLISPTLLVEPLLANLFSRMKLDLIRTASQISTMESATRVMQPEVLAFTLRVIPPPGNATDNRWRSITRVMMVPGEGELAGELQSQITIEGLDDEQQAAIAGDWLDLGNAWVRGDAPGVNAASFSLAQRLAEVNPELYPERARLGWESWYFRNDQLTRVWLVYMLSVILLLLGLVYQWPWARWSGMGVFLIALGLQTGAVILRWYISGRWPNANMFEAVTTAAWFGAAGALLLEIIVRRTGMRTIFALAAATSSMVALMAANFLPVYLNPNIDNKMPVLHDIWLYIHTNVIIFSYVLIFMAAISAMLYLGHRLFGGAASYARVGGAGSLVLGTGAGAAMGTEQSKPHARRARLGEMLDGVTMLLMELSFVLLWAGLVMGAIWADHSWGRPWGWDPKEVFALNTFLVFAVLVHVRLKVHDKGIWTAWLALIGAAVMLFNWIVINYVIVGLHSYA